MKLKADDLPNKDKKYQWNNCIYLNPEDARVIPRPPGQHPVDLSKLLEVKDFVFKYEEHKSVMRGTVGMSQTQRRITNLACGDEISVLPFSPPSSDYFLGVLKMTVDVLVQKTTETFDEKYIQDTFKSLFVGQHISLRQHVIMAYKDKFALLFKVTDVETVDLADLTNPSSPYTSSGPKVSSNGGILMGGTIVILKSETMKLVGGQGDDSGYVSPFKDLPNIMQQIGGLEKEFCEIFRRAFVLRLFPPSVLRAMQVKPVKGILLYGPPGCGKTLMAREIGKSLTGAEPEVVNGPELLNSYVGKSEENVRNLFKAAEDEWNRKGEASGLHVIIFDEIDALCKKRGSRSDNTGVMDGVVNQILTKIDGPKQLHNILVIGMTNRIDMLDDALIRPGRLGVHIEVGLPDEMGRQRIIQVHTRGLAESKMIANDVSFERLAQVTKNFTGAEIEMLIQNASSYALNRKINPETLQPTKSKDPIMVTWSDFVHALDQIKPAFGVADVELKDRMRNGIITFHPSVNDILGEAQMLVQQVSQSDVCPLVNVLIEGKPGTGKTALAARIAELSAFPFVKVLDAERLLGFPEYMRVSEITKTFMDAYRSPLSVIVIDEIERLLDYNPIGPRFNNSLFQAFAVMMKKIPPEGHKILIVTTTSVPSLLEDMQISDLFDVTLPTRTLSTSDEFRRVFVALGTFDEESDAEAAAQVLVGHALPIKKVILMADRMRMAGSARDAKLKRLSALAAELAKIR